MTSNTKASLLCASIFLLALSIQATPAVKLLVLIDTSQIAEGQGIAKARALSRDLAENLPPDIAPLFFHFGVDAELEAFDPFRPATLDAVLRRTGAETNRSAIQRALDQAGKRLCRRLPGEGLSKTAIVFVGGSNAGAGVEFGPCKSAVFVVGTDAAADGALRSLAATTGGKYYPFAEARGFILARDIRAAFPPSPSRIGPESNMKSPLIRPLGLWLAAGLGISGLIVWIIIRRKKNRAPMRLETLPVSTSAEPEGDRVQNATPPIEAFLRIQSEQEIGEFRLSVPEALILGGKQYTSPHVQILIPDPNVSREHCQVYFDGNAFWVADMGSESGTLVNGALLAKPRQLADGDMLQVGNTVFEFAVVAKEPSKQ